MRLVVGLGNPGARYEGTRHNVGFMVVDRISQNVTPPAVMTSRYSGQFALVDLESQRVGLLKPQTYMNRSGQSVAPALAAFELDVDDLLVVHDDLDLPFGAVKVKVGGGSGGHRGLNSCFQELETREFTRVRVGIGRPEPGGDATAYVLDGFGSDQTEQLDEVVRLAADAVRETIRAGAMAAMNRFNRRTNSVAPDGGEP